MSSKYSIILTWKKGKKKFEFPVLPEEIQIDGETKNNTITLLELGEVIEKGVPGIKTYSFSSIFPARIFGGVVTEVWRSPMHCIEVIEQLRTDQTVVKFTVSGMGISENCLITSFKYNEKGGDVGTINYSIVFKKYYKPKILKKKKKKKKSSSRSSKSNSKTYKVKKGDTLFLIAQKKLKDGSKWTKLWNLNKSKIKKLAKKHGLKATKNKHVLIPGMTIKLK